MGFSNVNLEPAYKEIQLVGHLRTMINFQIPQKEIFLTAE